MQSIKESLMDYIKKMPALPTSIAKVMEVCNDPTASASDLSKVISLDPVLMGRVMKLINSAYYGLNREITSLVRAIIMLGINTVKNLALSSAVLGAVGKTDSLAMNMEYFWIHSLSVGVCAKLIAQKSGVSKKHLEEFFVAGLLHDIGKIPFINKIPKEYKKTLDFAQAASVSLDGAEELQLLCNHVQIGHMIANHWNLSNVLTHVIMYHHQFYQGPYKKIVFAVSAANYFSNKMQIGFAGDTYPEELEKEVFHELGITLEDLMALDEEIKNAIEKARIFLRLTINT